MNPFQGILGPMDVALAAQPGSSLADDPYDIAKKRGQVVILPAPDELFIDIDTTAGIATLRSTMPVLAANGFQCVIVRETPSRTLGHLHIVLRTPSPVDDMTRVALQAALGSDPKREAMAVLRLITKCGRPATCFFENLPAGSESPGFRPDEKVAKE